jgi:hypothetical protein
MRAGARTTRRQIETRLTTVSAAHGVIEPSGAASVHLCI